MADREIITDKTLINNALPYDSLRNLAEKTTMT